MKKAKILLEEAGTYPFSPSQTLEEWNKTIERLQFPAKVTDIEIDEEYGSVSLELTFTTDETLDLYFYVDGDSGHPHVFVIEPDHEGDDEDLEFTTNNLSEINATVTEKNGTLFVNISDTSWLDLFLIETMTDIVGEFEDVAERRVTVVRDGKKVVKNTTIRRVKKRLTAKQRQGARVAARKRKIKQKQINRKRKLSNKKRGGLKRLKRRKGERTN